MLALESWFITWSRYRCGIISKKKCKSPFLSSKVLRVVFIHRWSCLLTSCWEDFYLNQLGGIFSYLKAENAAAGFHAGQLWSSLATPETSPCSSTLPEASLLAAALTSVTLSVNTPQFPHFHPVKRGSVVLCKWSTLHCPEHTSASISPPAPLTPSTWRLWGESAEFVCSDLIPVLWFSRAGLNEATGCWRCE